MSNKPTQIPNNELDREYLAETQKPTLADYYDVADKSKDGGMGEIFFCQDKRTKEFCVLKTFKTEKEDYENYFKQEAEFALSLEKHPNIVYTKTIAIEEGQNYMVMEFVGEEPKDIKDDVREKSRIILNEINEIKEISKEQVLKWALDFCEGMLYLISIGMKAHKDIKPSNLFITKDKTLKIGDFGITAIENKGGSPGYRAPEYFDNKAKLDIRSDIYAFGIVLHQIINGYNILNQTKLRTVNTTVMEEDENPVFPNPEAIESKYFIDIIRKCLQIEPNKRYQTIEELRADLLTEAKKINLVHTEAKFLEMTADDWCGKAIGSENLEEFNSAEKYYTKAIIFYTKIAVLYYRRGYVKATLKKYKDAIEDYNISISLDPNNYICFFYLGEAKSKLKQYKEAISDYNSFLHYLPKGREEYVLFKEVAIGAIAQCRKLYYKDIKINSETAKEYYDLGNIQNELGLYQEALDNYYKAILINPIYAEYCADKMSQYDCNYAIKLYTEAIKLSPNNSSNYNNRGVMKEDLKLYEDAIKDYTEAIRVNPKNVTAYYNRARVKDFLEQYMSAIDDYNLAIKLNPKKSVFYYKFIAFDKKMLGQYLESIKIYDLVIELNPKDAAAYAFRGEVKVILKQYEEAIKDYDKSIELGFLYDYKNRGIANYFLKQYTQAIADMQKYIELTTDPQKKKEAQEFIEKIKKEQGLN